MVSTDLCSPSIVAFFLIFHYFITLNSSNISWAMKMSFFCSAAKVTRFLTSAVSAILKYHGSLSKPSLINYHKTKTTSYMEHSILHSNCSEKNGESKRSSELHETKMYIFVNVRYFPNALSVEMIYNPHHSSIKIFGRDEGTEKLTVTAEEYEEEPHVCKSSQLEYMIIFFRFSWRLRILDLQIIPEWKSKAYSIEMFNKKIYFCSSV